MEQQEKGNVLKADCKVSVIIGVVLKFRALQEILESDWKVIVHRWPKTQYLTGGRCG